MATRDRTKSMDDDYDYSDDFISDEDPDQSLRRTPKSSYAGSTKQRAPMRKKGGGVRSGPNNSRAKKGKPPTGRSMDPVASRVLSASRHRMNELRNQVEELRIQLTDMKEENRILKKMQHRQERALEKFEGQESDLPQLISKHQNELRTVREQLRRMREKYEKTDRYLRDAEDELERTKAKLKKFRELAEEKELPERQELSRKLNKAMLDMEEKDRRVKELERYVENLKKNHRHELGVEMARHRDCKRDLEDMAEKFKKTETSLKEKEKELEIKFIYSNRGRPASKLPASYGGTPHSNTPPPGRHRRAPSLQDLSPREKARAYETRRREEMRTKNHSLPPRAKRDLKRAEMTNSFERPSDTDGSLRDSLTDNRRIQEWEQEERSRREEEDLGHQQQHLERSGLDQQLADMKRREAQLRADEERVWREAEEERDRLREEKARQERQDRERQDRERQERERREKEEQARREKERQEQQERKAREERERLANDAKALEEKRKKDMLLARLKQLDHQDQSDPFAIPTSGSKAPASTSSTSAKGSFFMTDDSRSQKSAGLASSAVSSPPARGRRQQSGGDTLDLGGGYQPSFTSHQGGGRNRGAGSSLFAESKDSSTTASTDRKSKLMADLFGKSSNNTSSQPVQENGDELFTLSDSPKKTAGTASRPSKFPWEESKNAGKTTSANQRQNSSTIFGGGSALVDEEPTPNDTSKMLPRRQRQPSSTFQSKPAVTAVDHYDDDIEEVIL